MRQSIGTLSSGSLGPTVILLDLNLPSFRMGVRCLADLKEDDRYKTTPRACGPIELVTRPKRTVLTLLARYMPTASLTKPLDLGGFEPKIVRGIESFWLGLVKLPAEARRSHEIESGV